MKLYKTIYLHGKLITEFFFLLSHIFPWMNKHFSPSFDKTGLRNAIIKVTTQTRYHFLLFKLNSRAFFNVLISAVPN